MSMWAGHSTLVAAASSPWLACAFCCREETQAEYFETRLRTAVLHSLFLISDGDVEH
jgi:hypothetical protein